MTDEIIIRPDDQGKIDEILAHNCTVHIERMNGYSWYMGIDTPDGKHHQFWFGAKNGRSIVEFGHSETSKPEAAPPSEQPNEPKFYGSTGTEPRQGIAHTYSPQPEQTASRCGCEACKTVEHASDCAVHNEPASSNGPCNCGATPASDWIEWCGGECPVAPEMMVEADVGNGYTPRFLGPMAANTLNWSGYRGKPIIIAYRIVEDQK